VDHDGAAIGVEEGRRAEPERQPVRHRDVLGPAARVGFQAGQIAGMGAVGTLEAMLLAEGIEVVAGALKRGRLAPTRGVDVDPMAPGAQASGLHHDADPSVLLSEHG
jgi:hypothetical protein